MKIPAVYRPHGSFQNTMCERHKDLIIEESNHLTEADYQTWARG